MNSGPVVILVHSDLTATLSIKFNSRREHAIEFRTIKSFCMIQNGSHASLAFDVMSIKRLSNGHSVSKPLIIAIYMPPWRMFKRMRLRLLFD